jgi:hypothetical protein
VLTLSLLQVMDNVVPHMRRGAPGQQTVFRARFSAVSAPEVKAAMVRWSTLQLTKQCLRMRSAATAAVVAAAGYLYLLRQLVPARASVAFQQQHWMHALHVSLREGVCVCVCVCDVEGMIYDAFTHPTIVPTFEGPCIAISFAVTACQANLGAPNQAEALAVRAFHQKSLHCRFCRCRCASGQPGGAQPG